MNDSGLALIDEIPLINAGDSDVDTMHELPEEVRRETIAEAVRFTRPGGKIVFVDYHGPRRSNPLRWLMRHVLRWLELFALDLWRTELTDYLPRGFPRKQVSSRFCCDGLYQKVVVTC